MIHTALTFSQFMHDVWHWKSGYGYQWWSGIGSVFTPKDVAAVAIVWAFLRKHNCHVHRCWRLQWHVHPQHGHPVCKKHHPHDPHDLHMVRRYHDRETGQTTSDRTW